MLVCRFELESRWVTAMEAELMRGSGKSTVRYPRSSAPKTLGAYLLAQELFGSMEQFRRALLDYRSWSCSILVHRGFCSIGGMTTPQDESQPHLELIVFDNRTPAYPLWKTDIPILTLKV